MARLERIRAEMARDEPIVPETPGGRGSHLEQPGDANLNRRVKDVLPVEPA